MFKRFMRLLGFNIVTKEELQEMKKASVQEVSDADATGDFRQFIFTTQIFINDVFAITKEHGSDVSLWNLEALMTFGDAITKMSKGTNK